MLILLLLLNTVILALTYKSVDGMVAACEQSLTLLDRVANKKERYIAASNLNHDEHGEYGEFPARQFAEILHHKSVRAVAEQSAHFVDIGSGAGRICLAVASMHTWASVTGIEASEILHRVASKAVKISEKKGVLPAGTVKSFHSDGAPLHEKPVADMLSQADIVFVYSTAFSDELTLPQFSASLSSTLKEGSIAITTDKWLIGERFHFVDLMTVRGEEDEVLQVHIWRLSGQPQGFDEAVAEIEKNWMGEAEDLCTIEDQGYDRACEALTDALENMPEDIRLRVEEAEREAQLREEEFNSDEM